MSVNYNPSIVTSGLVLCLDAANPRSLFSTVDILLVGGGGAGGTNLCGTGGGGAVGYFTGFKISAGKAYAITVGTGGVVTGNYTPSGSGVDTAAFGETAGGGQGGGQGSVNKSGNTGTMTVQAPSTQYSTAIIGSGYAGGNSTGYNAGSGGGGAGAAAVSFTAGNSSVSSPATTGGAGLRCDILGPAYYWGGGGGGEGYPDYAGSGGIGGGGGGGTFALGGTNPNVGLGGGSALNSGAPGTQLNNTTNGGAGGTNTGGGGGGGSHTGGGQTSTTGGAGGSGIVVVRYPGPQQATGGAITSVNGYTIHTFTVTGTFTPAPNWTDVSGNGNTGTLTNGPNYNSVNMGSIVFDGVDDYVTTGSIDFAALAFVSGFTINLWVYPSSAGRAALFASASGSSGTQWQTYVWSDTSTFGTAQRYGAGSQNDFSTPANYPINYWYNVTVTSNNTTSYIYVNGQQITSAGTGIIVNQPASREVWLGGFKNYSIPFLGKMSDTSVYNRALSAAEVAQNFNALRGRYGI